MSANYTLGPAWIFTSDNITDPLSSWTKLAMTRDGVIVRTSSGFLSMARSDQNGLTPLAESVRQVGAQLDGAETTFLNNDIDEILRAIPGGVKITNTTKEAIGFGQVTATLSPKAFAVVPVDDYNEDTPGSWYSSDNVWYFEDALMEITGETSFALREGEDNLEGYTVDIKPFANTTAGAYMGGRGLYRRLVFKELTVGDNPGGVAISPDGAKMIVCNRNDNSVTIYSFSDASTSTVSTGTFPQFVEISPDSSTAVVTNRDSDNITVIDLSDNTTTAVTVGDQPIGVAITVDNLEAIVVNAGTNNITRVVLSTSGTTNVTVGTAPRLIAVTPDGTEAIVANSGTNNVTIITLSDNTTRTVSVGTGPFGVAVTPDGAYALVTNFNTDNVTKIDLSDDSTSAISVGDQPLDLDITPDSRTAVVCNQGQTTATLIDLSDDSTELLEVGGVAYSISISPDGLLAAITTPSVDEVKMIARLL